MTRPFSILGIAIVAVALALTQTAHADSYYTVEIRIIEARPVAGGVDPKLKRYERDFKNLPYKSFKQLDAHTKRVRKGETVSMQFPGPGRRLLKVRANGTKGDKHGFKLSIDALRFNSTVRIPDNGTVIVAGPKHGNGVIMLAITARQEG